MTPTITQSYFGSDVLLIFVGHSDDGVTEANLIKELEPNLQAELSKLRRANPTICYRHVKIWEWSEDAGHHIGGQAAVITPELERADVAVFLFKERIGRVTWQELEFVRSKKSSAIVLAFFPETPPDLQRMGDRTVAKNWSDLLEKKDELSKDWTAKDSKSVRPIDNYNGGEHLRELALDRLTKVVVELACALSPIEPNVERNFAQLPQQNPGLQAYLTQLAESYRWLELQGIREAGTLQIELEKVYVALKAEPESEYDRQQMARLHTIELSEAAGVATLDLITPERLEEFESANIRRTYRPRKEEMKRATVTEVRTVGDVFRHHRRIVILGGPGSGKSTLGRWLALQFANGLLRQFDSDVAPENSLRTPFDPFVRTPPGVPFTFSAANFSLRDDDIVKEVRVESLPVRGSLALGGVPVVIGQIIEANHIPAMTFTPAANESGAGYASYKFSIKTGTDFSASATMCIDVPVHVRVPVSQIDPDPVTLRAPNDLVDLGPARLPIFLRIAHYARELADRERQQRATIPLIDYLGLDPDSCSLVDDCTPEQRNALFQSFIDAKRAVVILDGLDELAEANRRTVVSRIQKFIGKHTAQDGPGEGAAPWQDGGNQVVVTSRYVGYKLAPVGAGCVHFGIQSMQRPAVERFAYSWTEAVNAELAAERREGIAAEKLIAEIYNDARPAVRELATNPLLVTILATVYWADGHLPDQRAGVYDRVVENLLTIWLQRQECRIHSLTREELLAALEPLAAELQENTSSNGLIELARISELVAGPLAHLRQMNPNERRFRPVLQSLLGTIRKHVGLLAEQSPRNYAFFHRTFQEFLAARWLLADHEKAAEKISEKLDDPLWREPLLLAMGFAMIDREWGHFERAHLLAEVLEADGPEALIPRGALLVVSALPDMRDAPLAVVEQTVVRLLTSYAISLDEAQASTLREQIEQAFVRLKEGHHADIVLRQVAEVIRWQSGARDLTPAAALLLRRINWFTTELVESLLLAVNRDQAKLDWPIRRALITALGHRPAVVPWLGAPPSLNMGRLAARLPMRRLLESAPDLVAFINDDTDWLWLMIALYGGLSQVQFCEHFDRVNDERIRATQDRTAPVHAALTEAVTIERLFSNPIAFSAYDVVHDLADSQLSREVQRHLSARKPARELVRLFREKWTQGNNAAACAEALAGLAALGEDVLPLLRTAQTQANRQGATQATLDLFGWIKQLVEEPLVRTLDGVLRAIPDDAPEPHRFDLLAIGLEALMASGSRPLKVSDRIAAYRFVSATRPASRASLEAEFWCYVFSGDDAGCEGTVASAFAGKLTSWPVERLIESWALVHKARNHQSGRRLPWPHAMLLPAPRPDSAVDQYLAMLDNISSVPQDFQFLAGRVLGRCRRFVKEHPSLLWETLALIWGQEKEFWDGYRSVPMSFMVTDRSLAFLQTKGVSQSILFNLRRVKGNEFDAQSAFVAQAAEGVDPHDWDTHRNVVLSQAGDWPFPDDYLIWKSAAEFLDQVPMIDNPYLRFRARWRLVRAFAFGDVFLAKNLPKDDLAWNAIRWAPVSADPLAHESVAAGLRTVLEEIDDPHNQVRAFEWIAMTIPLMYVEMWDGIAKALSRIDDPENRGRAQCRLAYIGSERCEDLLRGAVSSISEIGDSERKAETIREVRADWGQREGMQQALDAIAQTIPDLWQRDKALGRSSRLVDSYRGQYASGSLVWRLPNSSGRDARSFRSNYPTGRLPWGLVYLSSTAAELGQLGAATSAEEGQWTRLLGPERTAGIAALVSAGMETGIPVGAREASVLDRIVQSGHVTDLDMLWPVLERPDPGALSAITRWSGRSDRIGQWSSLVQLEAGRLTPDNINSVIDLLCDSTDRLKHRAALALHGRYPYCENKSRRWSVRRVGIEALETVARRATQPDCPSAILSSLNWVHHDIHIDDSKALSHWLAQVVASNGQTSAASWILGWTESIQTELVPDLVAALESSAPEGQRTLLFALARLAHCSETLQNHSHVILRAIAAVTPDVRRSVCVLPDGPVALLRIAQKVAGMPRERRIVEAHEMVRQNEIWMAQDKKADVVERLGAIGRQLYIYSPSYWESPVKLAAALAENTTILSFLVSWLESEHKNDGPPRLVRDLLTATEAVARISPVAFSVVADPKVWEPILTELVQTGNHWTARLAAVRLLGHLRCITEHVVLALRAAMNDCCDVQEAAYEAVSQFRRVEGDILGDLLLLLDDPNTGVAAATARLLCAVSRGEEVAVDRRRILRGLQGVVDRFSMARPVYLVERSNSLGMNDRIRYVDRLDRIIYRSIFEISGL